MSLNGGLFLVTCDYTGRLQSLNKEINKKVQILIMRFPDTNPGSLTFNYLSLEFPFSQSDSGVWRRREEKKKEEKSIFQIGVQKEMEL